MPYYPDLSTLPEDVRNSLPLHARVIYMNTFNHAWEDNQAADKNQAGGSRVDTAGRMAWEAVMKVYEKEDGTGKWKRKTSIMAN
jgi:cation transport regulator